MSYPPPYGYPPAQPPGANDPRNTPVLVTGILSLACCGLFGIYAFVVGNQLRKDYGTIPSTAMVGYVLGIVGFAIQAVGVLFYVVVLLIALATSTA